MVAKRVLGRGGKDDGATDTGGADAADRAGAEDGVKVVPIAKVKAPPKPAKPSGQSETESGGKTETARGESETRQRTGEPLARRRRPPGRENLDR